MVYLLPEEELDSASERVRAPLRRVQSEDVEIGYKHVRREK